MRLGIIHHESFTELPNRLLRFGFSFLFLKRFCFKFKLAASLSLSLVAKAAMVE